MTLKKPNFIITFDDSNPTAEEEKLYFKRLLKLLAEIALEDYLKNTKFKNAIEKKATKKYLEKFVENTTKD